VVGSAGAERARHPLGRELRLMIRREGCQVDLNKVTMWPKHALQQTRPKRCGSLWLGVGVLMTFPMPPAPRLNADFLWECSVCRRPYRHPQRAADCACPAKKPLTVAAPLVRCSELPMFDVDLLALTSWREADQAELTLLHRPEAEGALKATACRFCASRRSLEPTGTFAFVPA
jgi:hypothetical protein